MAKGKPIQYDELIDPKAIKKLSKELDELRKKFESLTGGKSSNIKATNEALNKTLTVTKKLIGSKVKQNEIDKQLQNSVNKLNNTRKTESQLIIANTEATKKKTRADRLNYQASQALKGSYDAIQIAIKQNTIEYKKMSAAERDNTKAGTQLAATIKKQEAALKKLDARMGRSYRNVGNYTGAIMGAGRALMSAFGVGGALFMAVNALKGAINTIKNFGKQNAILAGILGKQRSELKALQNQAISLGRIYPTLTSEVVKLQIAYARLGFTQGEILDLTEATILGSIAMNSGLEETATMVGAIVKAFDSLESKDTPQIIDALTKSTTISSLNFEKLATAVPKVAGAASAMNIPLEKMLAMLAIAQDATQDASIAGTSLRNIFIQLAKEGQTLEEGLTEIATSNNKLTTANEKFGRRASITALALAKNIKKIGEWDIALQKAGGTAEKLAKEQMNTLAGSIDKLSSAWEAMILQARDSEGVMKGFIDNLTYAINLISKGAGAGGFVAGLLGINKEEFKKGEDEIKAFYQNIKKITDEELNILLQTTVDANLKAESENDRSTQRITRIRLNAIAKEQYARHEDIQKKKADNLNKETLEIQHLAKIKSINATHADALIAKKIKIANEEIRIAKEKFEKLTGIEAGYNEEGKEHIKGRTEEGEKLAKSDEESAAIKIESEKQVLGATADTMNNIGALMKEGSAEQKLFQTAAATINTYAAANAALNDPSPLPFFVKIANAVAAITFGLVNVAKINSVGFAEGTDYVDQPGAPMGRDTISAQVDRGEMILTRDEGAAVRALGITHNDVPGMVAIGQNYTNNEPGLIRLASAQLNEQQKTNRKLSGFKWVNPNDKSINRI